MSRRSEIKQTPTFKEYHDFLEKTDKPKILKNTEYYLKQYSFFKSLADAMPCAVYMLDYATQKYLFVSESCKSITGYTSEECVKMGQKEWVKQLMYKNDAKVFGDKIFVHFVDAAKQLSGDEIKNCRFSLNYRLKRKDGVIIKILQQSVILEATTAGYPILILGIVTDITAHKPDNKMVFSISHYSKEKGFKTISSDSFSSDEGFLTDREKEITKHIAYGHNSAKIADILCISPFTVKAHRRNILEKTNCKNMAELINYAINNGFT